MNRTVTYRVGPFAVTVDGVSPREHAVVSFISLVLGVVLFVGASWVLIHNFILMTGGHGGVWNVVFMILSAGWIVSSLLPIKQT